MTQWGIDFVFTKGQSYTKAEALLDLLSKPDVLQDKCRYNKLLLRWSWANKKAIARFIEQLEQNGVIIQGKLAYHVDQSPIDEPVVNNEVKDVKKRAYKEPEEIRQLDVNVYREIDHLKLMNSQYEVIIKLGYTKEMLDEILDDIANSAYNKKYTDLFITAKKWLKKNYPNINQGNLFPEQEAEIKHVSLSNTVI